MSDGKWQDNYQNFLTLIQRIRIRIRKQTSFAYGHVLSTVVSLRSVVLLPAIYQQAAARKGHCFEIYLYVLYIYYL
jgi:hypothetical protein